MTQKIMEDLARRLHDKIVEQMADYVDLCERSGCDRNDVTDHMLAVLVREAMIGMIASGMNKKEVLTTMSRADDQTRPDITKDLKKARRARNGT